jgi:putative transposase
MALLSYTFRLYPNRAQADALTGMLGAFCDLYNAGLQQRIEAYRRCGLSLRYLDQANELKAVRGTDERLVGFSFSAEQQVLRRLDKAVKAFFRRLKDRNGKAGVPRFQSKSRFDSAEFRVGDGLTIRKTKRLGITGIPGEIKIKWHRALPEGAKVGAAVLSRSNGQWLVCFQTEVERPAVERPVSTVGVDMGLSSLVALSTGETIQAPPWTKRAAKGLRRRQRALARKRRFSAGWKRAKRAVARYQAKVAARRRDFLHKLSHRLVREHSRIALEDLNVRGLARTMLAKAVHNAAWPQLIAMLSYKAANAGGEVVLVDPRGTSQTCPECGTIKAKTLAEREHRCDCGAVLDRDVAAAMVVHRRAFGFAPGHGVRYLSGPVAAQLFREAACGSDGVVTTRASMHNPALRCTAMALSPRSRGWPDP